MNLKEILQTAWKNKGVIMEGFYNAYVSQSKEVKAEALRRLEICRTNQCGLYDPKGQSEKAVFKGKESCGGCGCDLYAKCHAMSAHCFLKDLGDLDKEPLWDSLMTVEQEMEINKIAYKRQFENRNK
jgi:hypothetical protein